jgi:hypothetical protein
MKGIPIKFDGDLGHVSGEFNRNPSQFFRGFGDLKVNDSRVGQNVQNAASGFLKGFLGRF